MLPYYKALGFTITGPQFSHCEGGVSLPMMLDLVKRGEVLGNEGGTRDYLRLVVRAQAITLIDRVRGCAAGQ